jgi:hypothetical protein
LAEEGAGMSERGKREDLHDAVEDAVGFNFRSVKTLWHLIITPRRVFEAYAARDRVTYTPAIRLFFGLVGLQVLGSALWGGWDGMLRAQIAAMAPEARAQFESWANGDLDTFIGHYANAATFAQPIIVALFTSLSVFVLGWFRPQLTWPSRLNIAMGVLSVGTLVGLFAMPLLTSPGFENWAWIASAVVAFAYFMTTLRGARGVIADTFVGVWVKSIVYTLVLMVLVILAGFVLGMVCVIYALAMV